MDNAALEVREAIDRQMALEIRRRLRAGGYDPGAGGAVLLRRLGAAARLRGGRSPGHRAGLRLPLRLGVQRLRVLDHQCPSRLCADPRHPDEPDGCRRRGAGGVPRAGAGRHARRGGSRRRRSGLRRKSSSRPGKRFRTVPVRGPPGNRRQDAGGRGAGASRRSTFPPSARVPHWTPGQGDSRGPPRAPAPRSAGAPCAGVAGGPARDPGLRPRQPETGATSSAAPRWSTAPDTSYAVAPGWRLAVDDYANFVMTRSEG